MPDDPHVPETGFMLAAEKAIAELQKTSNQAQKDARWRKIQVRVLGLVSIILLVVCVFGGLQYKHTNDIARQVQQGSIAQCLDGNHVRADDIKIWTTFVGILEGPHPTGPVVAEAKSFESFIAKVYAPKDCAALFGASAVADNNDAG